MMTTVPTIPMDIHSLESKSYYSSIPDLVFSLKDESIILGVDEAGRGPVLGPMVYGVAYCTSEYAETTLKQYEFDDSKKLTDFVRRKLFKQIYTGEISGIGYATTGITPADISAGMMKYPPEQNYNLNEQAHDVTMALIQGVLDAGVNISHVYVDTVGPPITYQSKLEKRFPNCKITVAKKADSLYPIVSVASVIAKVTRDVWLDLLKTQPDEVLGSGYPGDQKTVKWLKESIKPLFGWSPELVRFSWQTARTMVDNNPKMIPIEWEEDAQKNRSFKASSKSTVSTFTQKRTKSPNIMSVVSLDAWYGAWTS